MKRFTNLIIVSLLPICLLAQPDISRVEYWYDGDYGTTTQQTVSGPSVLFSDLLDVSTLEPGLHTVTFRFQDERGIWGSVLSKFFTYNKEALPGIRMITDVEYWYDGNYSTAVETSLASGASINWNSLLDVSSLNNGLHTVSCRFKDARGIWGSPFIRFFKKEAASGLKQLTALEYWFNNDYANKVSNSFVPTSLLNLNEMFDVSALPIGFQFVSIRLQDEQGKWSPVASWYFTKENQEDLPELHQLTALEYWFNGDYSTVQTDLVAATPLLNIDTDLDVSGLNDGLHMVSCRYQDEAGNWSPAFSRLFAKYPAKPAPGMHDLVAVEYWFNGNLASTVKSVIPTGSEYLLDTQLDVSALNNGLHSITYRFQDETGTWSPGITRLFAKYEDETITTGNKIVAYRYWSNTAIVSAIEVDLPIPVATLALDDLVDVSSLPGGTNDISFQFKDSTGNWSSALTKSYYQDYNPRGTITAETDPACSNSVVTFTAATTDVDSIFWDFGDTTAVVGRTASENAFHAYTKAGTYIISATLLNVDSAYTATATTNITINQSYGVSVVAPENLVAYYPLDGDATDASGNGHDGTVSGATLTEDQNGTANSAYLFDGNDGISIQHSDELNMSEALSFSCWIKPAVLQNAMIFGKSNYTTATNYLLRIQSDGNLQWEYNGYLNTTTRPLEADRWYNIVVTANNPGGHRQIYINGQLIAESTSSSGPFGSITNPLTIGYASRGAEYFKGAIDDLRMYNKVLSPPEIFQLYQGTEGSTLPPIEAEICASEVPYTFGSQLLSTSGTYYETYPTVDGCDSVVQLNLTVHPIYNDTIGDPSNSLVMDDFESGALGTLPAGWVIRYNGTGNADQKIVNTPVKNGAQSFQVSGSSWAANLSKQVSTVYEKSTLEGWMYATNVASGGRCGMGLGNPSIGSWGAFLGRVESYNGNLITFNYSGNSGGYGTQYVLQPATSNTWYHLRMEFDFSTGKYKVFVNGTQVTATSGGEVVSEFPILNGVTPTSVELYGNSMVYFDDVKLYESGSYGIVLCSSETPYTFGTQQLTESGTYTETFQSEFGCDSTVTLNLNVHSSYTRKDTLTICEDELPYQWGDSTLIAAGSYSRAYTTVNGCDSIFSFTLNVTDTFLVEQNVTLCETDLPLAFGAQTLDSSGTFTEIFTGSNGCDSTVILTLTVLDTSLVCEKLTICENDLPYTFGTQSLLAGGNYLEVFTRENGCDSTVMLALTVSDTFVVADTLVLCENDLPYQFGTQPLFTAGNYTEVFTSANGCDSTVSLAFTVNDTFIVRQQTTVCSSELPLTLGAQSLTYAGVYTEVFSSTSGCDSTVVLSLTVKDTFDVADTVSVCANSLPYRFGLQELSSNGTYTETFASSAGCDSTVTLVFSVSDTFASAYSDTICENDLPYTFGTQSLLLSGTYKETFTGINSCDSVVTLQLTVNATNETKRTAYVKISDLPYIFEGKAVTKAGTYTHKLLNSNGCDSTIILKLYVEDDIPPEIVCNTTTIVLSEEGTYTLTPDDISTITNGTKDNQTSYGDMDISITPSVFSCEHLGETLIQATAIDENGNQAKCQVNVVVTASAIAPVIDKIADTTVYEDSQVNIPLSGIFAGTVCEKKEVVITASNINHSLIDSINVIHTPMDSCAILNIQLAANESGKDTITVIAEDEEGARTIQTFVLDVAPVNDCPFIVNKLEDLNMIAHDTLCISLSTVLNTIVNDIDDSILVYNLKLASNEEKPDWFVATNTENEILIDFQPLQTDTGCYNVVLEATDPKGACATDTFELCVEKLLVGINDIYNSEPEFIIYPNPSRGEVTIEFSETLNHAIELKIMSITGAEVLRKNYLPAEQIKFDISNHVSGTYLIILQTDRKRMVRTLILDKK
uniref:LamG-like jellyroll fold domain-containing protein n=1 Tax=uncultured Draconibacterium sp. TaxID=1573823 RepID=UPI00321796AE